MNTMRSVALVVIFSLLLHTITSAETRRAAVSSIQATELADFRNYPNEVKAIVAEALKLTCQNLTYTFNSADPRRGGMDCSGAIHHVLKSNGYDATPRQSDQMAAWVAKHSTLHRTDSAQSLSDPVFSALKPGDLVFWSGTYNAKARQVPVTHVMLYLGRLAKNGKPVVFGASDGRRYEGQKRTGVSIFDLSLPRRGSTSRLYGFGSIPGLRG